MRIRLLSSLAFITGLLFLQILPVAAHGTMQKIVEGKYLVNLSSAPIAPYVGQEQQNIIAISDVATDSLITKSSVFDIELHKDDKPVYVGRNLVGTGGLLSFHYTYPSAGTYELFIKFHFPSDSHIYEPEDYWVQVNPKQQQAAPQSVMQAPPPLPVSTMAISIVVACLAGIVLGRFWR